MLQQQCFDLGNHARREGRVDLDSVQIEWLGVYRSPFIRFTPRTESLLSKVALQFASVGSQLGGHVDAHNFDARDAKHCRTLSWEAVGGGDEGGDFGDGPFNIDM